MFKALHYNTYKGRGDVKVWCMVLHVHLYVRIVTLLINLSNFKIYYSIAKISVKNHTYVQSKVNLPLQHVVNSHRAGPMCKDLHYFCILSDQLEHTFSNILILEKYWFSKTIFISKNKNNSENGPHYFKPSIYWICKVTAKITTVKQLFDV